MILARYDTKWCTCTPKLFSFEEWLPVSSWSKKLAWGLQAIHIDTCNCKDFQYVGWMWQLNGHLSPCAEVDCFNRWDANSVRDFRGWTRQSAMVQRDAATVMVYLFGTTWQDLTSRGNKRKCWNYIYIYIEYIYIHIFIIYFISNIAKDYNLIPYKENYNPPPRCRKVPWCSTNLYHCIYVLCTVCNETWHIPYHFIWCRYSRS